MNIMGKEVWKISKAYVLQMWAHISVRVHISSLDYIKPQLAIW
jgi:hypothetical protein